MGYVDFHAHILPKADHGSDSVETSLWQLKKAKSVGVDTIFATPHFYIDRDTVDDFLSRRELALDVLRTAAENENINIKLIKSAEVNLQNGLASQPDIEKLCIENTNYMLIEPPFLERWGDWVFSAIDELRDRNIEPIIAHIDRYDDDEVNRLIDYDVMMQLNAMSLQRFFKKRRYKEMIDDNLIFFLGSDIHMQDRQYDYFKKAAKYYGYRAMRKFTQNTHNLFN